MKRIQFPVPVLLVCVLFLAGCATSSGVFPSGKDTYTVVVDGDTTMGRLAKQAYQEANAFCESRGKVMQPISTRSGPYQGFQLTFRALDPDDPEYRRPVLEPVPDARIEVRGQ